jgi:hypothetical protein
MATQRPGGTRPTTSHGNAPRTNASKPGAPRQGAPWGDLNADTAIWHTRGLQTNTRMRVPVAQRTPPRQLPPSQVPKLILWALLIGVALVCFQAVKHML